MEQEYVVEQIQHFVLLAMPQMNTARSCPARISSIRPRLHTERCDLAASAAQSYGR